MAMNDGFIREVDEELAEDKQFKALKTALPWLVAGAIALVVGVGGWQFWQAEKSATAGKAAELFDTADKISTEDPLAGLAAFQDIANSGPDGYAALASIRTAMTHAELGQREQAIAAYLAAADQAGVPERFKKFCRLKAAHLALEDGRDKTRQVLQSLEAEESALGAMAREVMGLAAIDAGDYGTAKNVFDALQQDANATPGVQQRAIEFSALAQLGGQGVGLELNTGSASDALVDLFNSAPDSAPVEPDETPLEEGGTSGN